jgi:hypothetical protein
MNLCKRPVAITKDNLTVARMCRLKSDHEGDHETIYLGRIYRWKA